MCLPSPLSPSLPSGCGFIVSYELPSSLYFQFKTKQTFRHSTPFPPSLPPIVLTPCSEFLFHDLISTLRTPPSLQQPAEAKASALNSPAVCWQPLLDAAVHSHERYPAMQRMTVHYRTVETTQYHTFSVLNTLFPFFNTSFQVQNQYLFFVVVVCFFSE